MANGSMGRKIDEATGIRALELVAKGIRCSRAPEGRRLQRCQLRQDEEREILQEWYALQFLPSPSPARHGEKCEFVAATALR